jgi:hypothetical protein
LINKIFEKVKFNKDFSGVVYELGAGQAGFLRAFEEKYPKSNLVGIEYSFLPYWMTRMQLVFSKSKIKIKKKNMFKVDLKDADVVYCYLNTKMMKKLEKKFQEECKKGTTIISYQFILPNLKPDQILELGEYSRVYVYKI